MTKMLFLAIFFISVGVIISEEEDGCTFGAVYEECSELRDDDYTVITTVPETQELLEKCPSALKYFECYIEKKEKCSEGNDWEESIRIHAFGENYFEFVTNSYELAKDLCNEDSELHKAYTANVGCYKTLGEEADACYSKAKDVYQASFTLLNQTEPDDLEDDWISFRVMCIAELKYYECFLERKGQCNWEEGSFERFMKGSYGVTKDLCNEDSKLHKAYIANAECYRTLGGDVDTCLSLAKAVYRSSFALLNHTKPEDLEEEWISIEATCLLESVQIACLSEKVLKTCGEDAYDAMMEVITRSHVLTIYCSRDMVNILKTSILDSLDLDEAAREIYSHAFHTIEK